jgi:hypothetical protein
MIFESSGGEGARANVVVRARLRFVVSWLLSTANAQPEHPQCCDSRCEMPNIRGDLRQFRLNTRRCRCHATVPIRQPPPFASVPQTHSHFESDEIMKRALIIPRNRTLRTAGKAPSGRGSWFNRVLFEG